MRKKLLDFVAYVRVRYEDPIKFVCIWQGQIGPERCEQLKGLLAREKEQGIFHRFLS